MAIFRKLNDGAWGVLCVPKYDGAVESGKIVTVRKSDGSKQEAQIAEIIETLDDGATICSIVPRSQSAASKSVSYTRCQMCGAKASKYVRIYKSGECRDCYEERKMGY